MTTSYRRAPHAALCRLMSSAPHSTVGLVVVGPEHIAGLEAAVQLAGHLLHNHARVAELDGAQHLVGVRVTGLGLGLGLG